VDNWHLINVGKELMQRGHSLTVCSIYQNSDIGTVFKNTADVVRFSEVEHNLEKHFDCVLTGDTALHRLCLKKIYIFNCSSTVVRFGPGACDFSFNYRDRRDSAYWLRCANMPVGNPKNDSINFNTEEIKEKNQILYIDSGHTPFGKEGKVQIAGMLLRIARENPGYNLVIKPRWLRGRTTYMTHLNTLHLYDIIEERCNGEMPENLVMLNEHRDLHELIKESHSVISLNSTASIDALCEEKNLCILCNYRCDDKFDFRFINGEPKADMKDELDFYRLTGCVVNINDVYKYIPGGIKGNEDFIKDIFPFGVTGASKRIADVMEHVYENYLRYGKYPAIKNYSYANYKVEMTAGEFSKDEFFQIRIENTARKWLSDFLKNKITVMLDASSIYYWLEINYTNYSFNQNGIDALLREFEWRKKELILDNADKLSTNAIDQSYVLMAMFDLGYGYSIPNMQNVIAVGPWNFYAGRILLECGEEKEGLTCLVKFLSEANSRNYEKYEIEQTGRGYKTAYEIVFNHYNGLNVPHLDIACLFAALYAKNKENCVKYELRKKAYELMTSAMLYDLQFENGYMTNIRIEEEARKRFYHFHRVMHGLLNSPAPRAQKRRSVLERFHQCWKDHGLGYTLKLGFKKVAGLLKSKIHSKIDRAYNAAPLLIAKMYRRKILGGLKLYAKVMRKFGSGAKLYLSATGSGDTYVIAMYFNAFCKRRPSDEISVLCVADNQSKAAADLFDIENVEIISRKRFGRLVSLLVYDLKDITKLNTLHCHNAQHYAHIIIRLSGYKGMTCSMLTWQRSFADIPRNERQPPNFSYVGIEQLFTENSLIQDRTVLLVPKAKGVKGLPTKFWIWLARELSNVGFKVATNCVGDDKPIEGTVAVTFPYCNSVPFLEMAGVTIGVRSGFQDITESAKCLKISLYWDFNDNIKYSLSSNLIDTFSLSAFEQPNQYEFELRKSLHAEVALIHKLVNMAIDYVNSNGRTLA
jgi:hypothetical protein